MEAINKGSYGENGNPDAVVVFLEPEPEKPNGPVRKEQPQQRTGSLRPVCGRGNLTMEAVNKGSYGENGNQDAVVVFLEPEPEKA